MIKLDPDVIAYFPAHIEQMEEFQRIAGTYDKMLAAVWDDVGKIYDNNHFDSMDAEECARREEMLHITPTPLDTIDDRRRRIKGYYASNLPYTDKKMREVLAAMCGENGYELVIDKEHKTLFVGIKVNSTRMIDNAEELMRMMAPATMSVEAKILYNIYSRFRPYTHAQMAAFTHLQLRTEDVFLWDVFMYADVGKYRHSALHQYTHRQIMMGDL